MLGLLLIVVCMTVRVRATHISKVKGTVILKTFQIWGGLSHLSGIIKDIPRNKKNLGLSNLVTPLGGSPRDLSKFAFIWGNY